MILWMNRFKLELNFLKKYFYDIEFYRNQYLVMYV
jgi:hypothetical protein